MPDAVRLAWRISNYTVLDGAGGLRVGGRWHTRGQRVVYLAETPAGALLEALVRVEPALQLPKYKLLRIELPGALAMAVADLAFSPGNRLDPGTTRAIGDRWLRAGATPLLRVPSAIVRETYNLLFNPTHPASAGVRITGAFRDAWDDRLLQPPRPEAEAQRSARRSRTE